MAELIFPLSFKRQYGGSLDTDLVFETIVDRDTYLTNPLRYAGQIVACKELEGKIFVLNNAMDEWLSQESADSCKVKISNDDITEDFLENKIVGTTDKISITKQNTGENETLIINVSTDVFDKTVDNTENITETENKVFVSPTEKTAITHINRDDLDLVSGTNTGDETNETIKTKLGTDLSNKVDKVTGKSLISDEEITRLSTVINYDDTAIQSHISDITIHVTSTEKETWNNKSDFDGAYSSLTDSPTIPTKISDLTNDSGFLTSIPSEYINETELATALTPKLEVTNIIQGTNVTLTKDGNNITISATGEISGGVAADVVTYDNTASGLTATNVKTAIDELENAIDNLQPKLISSTTTTATLLAPESFNAYTMAITANTTFILPTISDNTKHYEILINVSFSSASLTIAWGTTYFFNGTAPTIEVGNFNIIYEWDNLLQQWVCGIVKKAVIS